MQKPIAPVTSDFCSEGIVVEVFDACVWATIAISPVLRRQIGPSLFFNTALFRQAEPQRHGDTEKKFKQRLFGQSQSKSLRI